MPQSPSREQSRSELFRLLALLWLGGVAAPMPILAISPVIPLIHEDLHLSETEGGFLSRPPLRLFALAALPRSVLVARLRARPPTRSRVQLPPAAHRP